MRDTILTTKEALPGAKLDERLSAEEKSLKYKNILTKDFFKTYVVGGICRIIGETHDLYIHRRLAFDAPVDFDVTIVPLPKNPNAEVPRDPRVFMEQSREDALLELDLEFAIQSLFQDQGCQFAMSVSNTAPYDTNLTVKEGEIKFEKTPQSTVFQHSKVFGYREQDLEEITLASEDKDKVYRPLQRELDVIVTHLCKRLYLKTVKESNLPIGVHINSNDSFLDLYKEVFDVLMDISYANLGVVGDELIRDEILRLDDIRKYIGEGLDDSLRVWGKQAIDNISNFLENPDFKSDIVRSDNVLAGVVSEYLLAQQEYIKVELTGGRRIDFIYGPCFSNLQRLVSGNNITHFVDAAIVRKGGNTVTGIIPKESDRPLTEDEKQRILSSNKILVERLSGLYGDRLIIEESNWEEYFNTFKQ